MFQVRICYYACTQNVHPTVHSGITPSKSLLLHRPINNAEYPDMQDVSQSTDKFPCLARAHHASLFVLNAAYIIVSDSCHFNIQKVSTYKPKPFAHRYPLPDSLKPHPCPPPASSLHLRQ